jgi:hypothetical protein
VKDNYKNFLKDKKSSYLSPIFKIVQDLTTIEQSYIQTIARMNMISYPAVPDTGTDGLQAKSGPVRVYYISDDKVPNTLDGIVTDVSKIRTDLVEFNNIISSNSTFTYSANNNKYTAPLVFDVTPKGLSNQLETKDVFIPFSTTPEFADNKAFRRAYMVLSNDVIEKAARLMGENKKIVQSSNTQTSKPSQSQSNDLRKIVREELEKILTENGIIAESESKSNEVFQFKVGKHIFEGKITKVKKLS